MIEILCFLKCFDAKLHNIEQKGLRLGSQKHQDQVTAFFSLPGLPKAWLLSKAEELSYRKISTQKGHIKILRWEQIWAADCPPKSSLQQTGPLPWLAVALRLSSTTSEVAIWGALSWNTTQGPPSSGDYGFTWPVHQMTVLPHIYISFPQEPLFTQHRLLIVGNPKEQVRTPSLPTRQWETPGEDKNRAAHRLGSWEEMSPDTSKDAHETKKGWKCPPTTRSSRSGSG